MIDRDIPSCLWYYGIVYESKILSRISRGRDGRTGIEHLTGQTPDISKWLDFQFYNLIWFHNLEKPAMEDKSRRLGRWLGISHRIGSDMCYWVLTDSGQVISCATVQHVTTAERGTKDISNIVNHFNEKINERLSDVGYVQDGVGATSPYIEDFAIEATDDTPVGIMPTDEECGGMISEGKPEVDDFESYQEYIGSQILVDVGNMRIEGIVTKRARDAEGNLVGKSHRNTLFDTRKFVVESQDEVLGEYTVNQIVENIYAQADAEGNMHSVMAEIVDHRKDSSAILLQDGCTVDRQGKNTQR
jgi:hypothetical protein